MEFGGALIEHLAVPMLRSLCQRLQRAPPQADLIDAQHAANGPAARPVRADGCRHRQGRGDRGGHPLLH